MKFALFLLAYLCIAFVDGKQSCGSKYRKAKYELYQQQLYSTEYRAVKKFFKSTGNKCGSKCDKLMYKDLDYSFRYKTCFSDCCFKKLEEGRKLYGNHHYHHHHHHHDHKKHELENEILKSNEVTQKLPREWKGK